MTVILGGGISGLSAAHYISKRAKLESVVLLEASNRLGGWIRSHESPTGAIFEQGPRTVRPGGLGGKNTLDLIHDLKLSDRIIPIKSNHPAAQNRLIYVNNKLHLLPNSLRSLFKTNSPFDRPLISILLNDIKAPKVLKEDESIYSFVERRLGKDVADNLISPMICGICAGDAKQISVNFLMKTLFEGEQKYGSIGKGIVMNQLSKILTSPAKKDLTSIRNKSEGRERVDKIESPLAERAKKEKWSIWGIHGGLEQLPRTLANSLKSKGLDVHVGAKCEEISLKSDHVELKVNGKTRICSRVVSSLAAKNLAELVREQHPQLAAELAAIPTVTVGIVNLEFTGHILSIDAFGFLVPPKEKLPILGILTVMMGGAWFRQNFGDTPSKEHLLSVAVEQTRNILGIRETPVAYKVAILKDCIPQYIVGHVQRVNRIRNYISARGLPLALCGSSYEGVGLNDVILSAKRAVSDIDQGL